MTQFFPTPMVFFGTQPFGAIPAVDPILSTYDLTDYYRVYPGDSLHVAIEEADRYRYARPQPYGDHTLSPIVLATVPPGTSGGVIVRMSDGTYTDIYFTAGGSGFMSFVVSAPGEFIGGAGSNLGEPGVMDTVEALLASGELIISVENTGAPYTAPYIDFGFIGLIYPGQPLSSIPLRQWPRDDGLRRIPSRHGAPGATSRQASLRRGPRGTYS